MAVFPSFKLTEKGEELLNRSIGDGKTLTFTKFGLGDGNAPADFRKQTRLVNSFFELPVLDTSLQKDQVLRIKGYFDNKTFLEDKKLKEIGVFVKIAGDDTEYLYSYTNAGDTGDIIPANTRGFYARTLDVANYVGYATNINFNIIQLRDRYAFNTENEMKVATYLKAGDKVELWGNLVLGDKPVDEYIVQSGSGDIKLSNGLFAKRLNREYVSNTIEELKAMALKQGDVVEVLGYYQADDGATHKRLITQADDGSGVQLDNRLWANILHNGEVNVDWFGAKGNGTDDDTNNIQKSINSNSNIIHFNPKIYRITNIKLKSDLVLKGAGKSRTIIKRIDNYNLTNFDNYYRKNSMLDTYRNDPTTPYENIELRDITIDGNRDNIKYTDDDLLTKIRCNNIWLVSTNNIILTNCNIINSFGDGLGINGCNNVVVKNNNFKNCGLRKDIPYPKNSVSVSGIVYSDKEQKPLNVNTDNIVIDNNYIYDSKDEGIMFVGVKSITITDNMIEKCGDKFIEGDYQNRIYSDLKLIISNNIMKGAKNYAIGISDSIENSQINITDNLISGVSNIQFFVVNGKDTTDVIITGNVFENNLNESLISENAFTIACRNIIISNNIIRDFSSKGGVLFSLTGNNININGNIINTDNSPIFSFFEGKTNTKLIENVDISSNIINLKKNNADYNIKFGYTKPDLVFDNVKITSNSIKNCAKSAIKISSNINNLEFSHNKVDGVLNFTEKTISIDNPFKISELMYLFNNITNNKYSELDSDKIDKISSFSSNTPVVFPGSIGKKPTAFENKKGEFRFNSNPEELGNPGSKYIILGYVFDGTEWQEMRVLTGK